MMGADCKDRFVGSVGFVWMLVFRGRCWRMGIVIDDW